MRILLYANVLTSESEPYFFEVIDTLKEFGVHIGIYKDIRNHFIESNAEAVAGYEVIHDYYQLKEEMYDFLLSLGGDGTILNATLLVKDVNIPILGINLGRLGYLSSVEKTKIREAIQDLLEGAYSIDERTMLELKSKPELFKEQNFALNDFTIHKRDNSSMITVQTYMDDEFLNTYWADGLIISTQTGSTGYSLSCGGPIVAIGCDNFIITPVAPHNLNVRPVVLSEDVTLRFKVQGRADNFLCTLDSRYELITSEHEMTIKKADFKIKLVDLEKMSYFKTLRNKLMWGKDLRNKKMH
ncbi:NAD kinase [Membranicola marinus]|uniref:NAD kinase n=1 Tax=Membranihabitans marinus TaxID=1227546 RepID=A0A953HTW3_9BACT|nr:NAD kinase [Membranihabitans marinus]MBY5958131.1 NAD kinase [Membranihabitans marinus]